MSILEERAAAETPPWVNANTPPNHWSAGLMAPPNATADSLGTCQTVLAVQGTFGTRGAHIRFRLYDHSQMAEGLRQLEDGRAQEAENSATSLSL